MCDSSVLIKDPKTALLIRRRTGQCPLQDSGISPRPLARHLKRPNLVRTSTQVAPVDSTGGSSGPRFVWTFSSRRSRRRFWSTGPNLSPERGRAERSPVVGRREDDEAQAADAPGARGPSDPEVLKMDELDVMDRETVSRRRSVLTMLHLVPRLASLAQSRMNSYQERLIP